MLSVCSDFSGIGSFDAALKRLEVKSNNLFACDIDKYVEKSYHANNKPNAWFTDVYERPIPPEPVDIYMTSPPCQTFSVAGLREGEIDEKGMLFYNSLEFIRQNKPKSFIFENVKGLLSVDKGSVFTKWIDKLGGVSVNRIASGLTADADAVPYNIYYKVLNSKNFGVPQNRERVFIVGILADIESTFSFPGGKPCTSILGDVLESGVEEKHFLSEKRLEGLKKHKTRHDSKKGGFGFKTKDKKDISNCIMAGPAGKSNTDTFFYDTANTLTTMQGGGQEPKILCEGNVNPSGNGMNGNVFDIGGLSPTITTNKGEGVKVTDTMRIRKLTPLECWRLQGFTDKEFVAAQSSGVSNNQLYKQAGNSITVNVLEAILENLIKTIKENPNEYFKPRRLKECNFQMSDLRL